MHRRIEPQTERTFVTSTSRLFSVSEALNESTTLAPCDVIRGRTHLYWHLKHTISKKGPFVPVFRQANQKRWMLQNVGPLMCYSNRDTLQSLRLVVNDVNDVHEDRERGSVCRISCSENIHDNFRGGCRSDSRCSRRDVETSPSSEEFCWSQKCERWQLRVYSAHSGSPTDGRRRQAAAFVSHSFLLWKTFPCSMNSADGVRLREVLAEAVRRSRGSRKLT